MKLAEPKVTVMSPKRVAILQAATKEFCISGFSGTSMDKIAEVANVSKATVYNHFRSKDDLFQAILGELVLKIGEMETYEYSSEQPLDAQLKEIGKIFVETITSPEFMKLSRVVISRFIQSPKWARSAYAQQTKLRENLTRWIHAGIKDGRLDVSEPENAAGQFCGLIKEIVFWPELMWGQKAASSSERDAAVEAAVGIFLDHFCTNNQINEQ